MAEESGGFATQWDALLDAQLQVDPDSNCFVHETDPEGHGKIFFEVNRALVNDVVAAACRDGGPPPQSFCEALRRVVPGSPQ